MIRNRLIGTLAVLTLAIPRPGLAHEGHGHKVMGTIAAVTATRLDVKTQDGKTVSVALELKTAFLRGTAKEDAKRLRVGERVVVDTTGDKALVAAKAQTAAAPVAK